MGVWGFLTTSHDEILAIANVFIALGTIVLALGIPYAIKDAGREQRDTFYATLDRTYFEIQKLIIDHPHLAEPDLADKTPAQIVQYDAFAFIVWNFVESIYDYSKQEKELAVTWECILKYESAKHAEWFRKPENHPKFKNAFVEYIEGTGVLDLKSPSARRRS
jgi:hypothetical protein